MRTIALYLFVLLVAAESSAQQKYWIRFGQKDRSALNSVIPSELGISDRAMKRRAKVLPADRLIDEHDLPVSTSNKSALAAAGAQIVSESRWFNAVSVIMTDVQALQVRQLPIVAQCIPIPVAVRQEVVPVVESASHPKTLLKSASDLPFNYGASHYQTDPMNVSAVHQLGINGSGILVGMSDDGFNSRLTHRALKNIRVLAEYDFIQRDSVTSWQSGEDAIQGSHGTATLSVLAGFDNGKLIGPAFGASLLLSKTEMRSPEVRQELDNYIEALEWMERQGVDIVSTSLGYDDFDPAGVFNSEDIVYLMKDGRTSPVSIAATIATRKGVLLVTAMGNEGWLKRDTVSTSKSPVPDWHSVQGQTGSIVTPADADSIVAVGATFSFGEIATFSGTGPTADGRIKPEIVAPGVGIVAALSGTESTYYGIDGGSTQGTSFSTPLAASVAALILSAHPELTPMQVRDALMKTATHPIDSDPTHTATWPNNYYGHGMVNALDAVLYHGVVTGNLPVITHSDSSYKVTIWVKSKSTVIPDSVQLWYKATGAPAFQRKQFSPASAVGEYFVLLSKNEVDSSFTAFATVRDASGATARIPQAANGQTFALKVTPDSVLQYYPTPTASSTASSDLLYANFPNPFRDATTIRFELDEAKEVELAVFNILGQRVRTIVSGVMNKGMNAKVWDGRNEAGVHVSTGVYFCRLKTNKGIQIDKAVLLR